MPSVLARCAGRRGVQSRQDSIPARPVAIATTSPCRITPQPSLTPLAAAGDTQADALLAGIVLDDRNDLALHAAGAIGGHSPKATDLQGTILADRRDENRFASNRAVSGLRICDQPTGPPSAGSTMPAQCASCSIAARHTRASPPTSSPTSPPPERWRATWLWNASSRHWSWSTVAAIALSATE